MRNNKKPRWNASVICFCVFSIAMAVLIIQFCYLSLSTNIYGINMKEFAAKRNTVSDILTAERGTIYDIEGNVLAQNISSYTLIAYLDPARTTNPDNPKHVVDPEYTAMKLSTVLGEDNYEYILERLSKSSKQVEFGTIGRNLTELTKIAIEELDLPGILFTETTKRYYPNGNFASYIVGYAKQYTRINIKVGDTYNLYDYYKNFFDNYDEVSVISLNKDVVTINNTSVIGNMKGTSIVAIRTYGDTLANIVVNVTDYDVIKTMDTTIVGELGVESTYEDELEGTDGYIIYQQDKYGYKIPDTPEEKKESIDGYDIYLTIDSNIQRFAESTIKEIESGYDPEWAIVTAMDAKTGEILASATSPSFNPNSLPNNMNYQNPLASYTYEPGSVMKIYTYMCAIDKGVYDGSKKYLSGTYVFQDGSKISDWDKEGWGYLSYDMGFVYSSNVGIINIIKDYLTAAELKTCLESYGFNAKTELGLSSESKGNISFNYEGEVMSAGYGQGISTTAAQQLQALTIIANNGTMIQPHIISKMVNKQTNEEIVPKVSKKENVVKTSTVSKMKDLLEAVIQPNAPTGSRYYMDGYNIIGKTGTAQVFENGQYTEGYSNYVLSVALMYPKDNPQIIIYAVVKKPKKNSARVLYETIPEFVQNITKYKGILANDKDVEDASYVLESYLSSNTNSVKEILEKYKLDVILIGSGNTIIDQYPSKNTKVVAGDKVYLVTTGGEYFMPNMIGWSRLDVSKYCDLIGMECTFNNHGYVINQSIESGTAIDNNSILNITLSTLKLK